MFRYVGLASLSLASFLHCADTTAGEHGACLNECCEVDSCGCCCGEGCGCELFGCSGLSLLGDGGLIQKSDSCFNDFIDDQLE